MPDDTDREASARAVSYEDLPYLFLATLCGPMQQDGNRWSFTFDPAQMPNRFTIPDGTTVSRADLSRIVADSLVLNGFSRQEAMQLASEFQARLMTTYMKGRGE